MTDLAAVLGLAALCPGVPPDPRACALAFPALLVLDLTVGLCILLALAPLCSTRSGFSSAVLCCAPLCAALALCLELFALHRGLAALARRFNRGSFIPTGLGTTPNFFERAAPHVRPDFRDISAGLEGLREAKKGIDGLRSRGVIRFIDLDLANRRHIDEVEPDEEGLQDVMRSSSHSRADGAKMIAPAWAWICQIITLTGIFPQEGWDFKLRLDLDLSLLRELNLRSWTYIYLPVPDHMVHLERPTLQPCQFKANLLSMRVAVNSGTFSSITTT